MRGCEFSTDALPWGKVRSLQLFIHCTLSTSQHISFSYCCVGFIFKWTIFRDIFGKSRKIISGDEEDRLLFQRTWAWILAPMKGIHLTNHLMMNSSRGPVPFCRLCGHFHSHVHSYTQRHTQAYYFKITKINTFKVRFKKFFSLNLLNENINRHSSFPKNSSL